jgi:PAS domain S-box-containing protein
LRDGRVEGVLSLTRQHPAAFTERQVELVQTFAAQAVIAMENARLLTEQQEALARQTAMADILAAINAHPGNPQPAFDTILAHAHALCDSERGSVMLYDGDQYSAVATRGFPDDQSAAIRGGLPISKSPWAHALIAAGHRSVNVPDLRAVSGMSAQDRGFVERSEPRSYVAVALRRGDDVLGCITAVRTAVRPFSDKEIALLDSFAAQAVIAIENARLLTELRASLERQTATAEVLQIINANPGHLQPVFDAILEKAHGLCEATLGSLQLLDGETLRAVATRGVPEALDNILRAGYRARRGFLSSCGGPEQMIDLAAELAEHPDSELLRTVVEIGGFRTMLAVPLHKDGTLLGRIVAARTEVRPFADNEIGLIASFAAQAVIAMENARLLTELRARTDELAARNSDFAERIDQQAATIDVLKVMSASPGDPQPVFDLIVRRAPELCNGASAVLLEYDGTLVHFRAMHYLDARSPAAQEADEVYRNRYPMPPTRKLNSGRAILDGIICHIRDVEAAPDSAIETTRISALRSEVVVPLLRDGASIGVMMLTSRHVGGFSDSQVELLQTFAEQAVIAIAAAAAFRALQQRTAELAQRQDELRVTFENMNDGVALFDEHHCLVAWNANFPRILDLPEDTLVPGRPFADYIRTLAEHGEYGEGANVEEQVTRVLGLIGERRIFERARPGGRTVEVRNNPVADGGFVLIYADITERKRAEAEIAAARDAAEQSARTIEAAYRDLKIAQANLIQAEKMASLGQLTAGIAHEIKNPLNFVNNFSALSTELIDELREVLAPQPLIGAVRAEIDELTSTLRGNLEKVVQHGRRADGIVKSMLEHSRGASTERRAVDFNALVEEALNLAYHGARAQDQSFNVALERAYADDLAPIELNPQDITRVLLNLIGNGFHAARQRAVATQGHEPTLGVTTRALGGAVEIRVRDNGTGIPTDIRDRIFEPFFTTKPTGEGTGLGLSITYDIVTKQHGGTIEVDSAPGAFTEFTVTLPRSSDGAPA